MRNQSSLAEEIGPAIGKLKAFAAKAKRPAERSEFSEIMVRFSNLDAALIPLGQYDVDVQHELSVMLKGLYVEQVSPAFPDIVRQWVATQARERHSTGPAFRDLVDTIGQIGAQAGLDPYTVYWLRLVTYAAIVVHGTRGSRLPPLPLSPAQAALSKKERIPKIRLVTVPGIGRRGPYGDDGEEMSGQLEETHDPDMTDGHRI